MSTPFCPVDSSQILAESPRFTDRGQEASMAEGGRVNEATGFIWGQRFAGPANFCNLKAKNRQRLTVARAVHGKDCQVPLWRFTPAQPAACGSGDGIEPPQAGKPYEIRVRGV